MAQAALTQDRFSDKFLGNRLRQRREQLGISKADLARRMGVTAVAVEMYESGAKGLDATELPGWAAALDMEVDSLFRHARAPAHGEADIGLERRLALEVARAMHELPTTEQKRALVEGIERLIAELSGRPASKLLSAVSRDWLASQQRQSRSQVHDPYDR